MAQLEHIEAIEKRLWGAADTLRANSNYASNEYFLPVMGLVFLRHAYSRFLAVKDKIKGNLQERKRVKSLLSSFCCSARAKRRLDPMNRNYPKLYTNLLGFKGCSIRREGSAHENNSLD